MRQRGRESRGSGLPLRRTAGGEIGGDSEVEGAGRDGGSADDQIGSAAAQGSGAKVRAERLACGNRLRGVGPGLIALGSALGRRSI